MRDAIFVERNQFAVDDGVAFYVFEGLSDFNVAMTDDFAVTAVKRDLAALGLGDHAEAIVFILENPAPVVERRVRQRC